MAEVLWACVLEQSDRICGSLGRVASEARRKIAEADPHNPPSTLGNPITVLAGGEPNTFRSAARFVSQRKSNCQREKRQPEADSAIESASRAPSSNPRQHSRTHAPTPSGSPVAKAAAAERYSSALRIQ